MNFAHRMIEQVTYSSPGARSDAGDPTWDPQVTVAARVHRKQDYKLSNVGEEEATAIVVESETYIPIESRVWLPGSDTADVNDSEKVKAVEGGYTLDGSYTLYLHYM